MNSLRATCPRFRKLRNILRAIDFLLPHTKAFHRSSMQLRNPYRLSLPKTTPCTRRSSHHNCHSTLSKRTTKRTMRKTTHTFGTRARQASNLGRAAVRFNPMMIMKTRLIVQTTQMRIKTNNQIVKHPTKQNNLTKKDKLAMRSIMHP